MYVQIFISILFYIYLQHLDGTKKSPVLTQNQYVADHHPLNKVAEATGSKASRKKSIAHNELR